MLLSKMCLLGEGYVFHTHKNERKRSEGDRKKGGFTLIISFGVPKPCDKYVCEQSKTIHTHE